MNQSGSPPQDELLHRAGEALARRDPQSVFGLIDQVDTMARPHRGASIGG